MTRWLFLLLLDLSDLIHYAFYAVPYDLYVSNFDVREKID